MSDPSETKAERCDRMLGELSELGLKLARDLAQRALAAETPAEATDLALAFHRISRSLRQTLALEAKVERDRLIEAREAACEAARVEAEAAATRTARRKHEVRDVLERLIWEEGERDDFEVELLSAGLDEHLDAAARRVDFTEVPLETLIAQLQAEIGFEEALAREDAAPPGSPSAWPGGVDAWAAGRAPDGPPDAVNSS